MADEKEMKKYYLRYWWLALLAMLCKGLEVMADLVQPALMASIVDEGILGIGNGGTADLSIVKSLGLKMLVIIALGGFAGWIGGVFSNNYGQRSGNDIRKDCFQKVLHFSFSQVDRFTPGSLITRVSSDVTQVQLMLSDMVRGCMRSLVFLVAGTWFLLSLDLNFRTILTIAIVLVLLEIIWTVWKTNPMFMSLQEKLDRVNTVMRENISGVRVVKAFAQEERENAPWILHCEDSYYFMVGLLAMLQGGRKALVTANRQEAFIKEIQKPGYGFLTDEPFAGATLIQDVLQNTESDGRWNTFDKDSAPIVMYTSGTTGEPKMVPKMFCQFENELFELVKVFGDDWVNRKVYSTVNHHHIYGLLFTVLLPTATGLPYRRHRIDYPSELANIAGEAAVIASSPAYLKRLAADAEGPIAFKTTPIIYSSGGPLPEEVARKCEGITGYWTTEIYGSTETGGIAYRQSKNGPIWTPFEVCKMSIGENDCLNVKSSYILEPEGFTTGDLVEIYDDGRFLLKGRADSIVKIEEKRISLPEVENRLKQTGLVQDVRVVPMVGKRQYLAAAIVLNADGVARFKDQPKLEINNFFKAHLNQFLENTVTPKKWRYLEELPQDTQGKIKMRDIQALFGLPESKNFRILKMHKEPGALSLKLVFPADSDFYDGHFPAFKLLPAVAQVDMVALLAHALLETPRAVQKIQRTKFSYPVLPDAVTNLEMTFKADTNKVLFTYTNEAGRMLSTGTLVMQAGA